MIPHFGQVVPMYPRTITSEHHLWLSLGSMNPIIASAGLVHADLDHLALHVPVDSAQNDATGAVTIACPLPPGVKWHGRVPLKGPTCAGKEGGAVRPRP